MRPGTPAPRPGVEEEVRHAFERYDRAQLAGDQSALGQMFWDSPLVTRCGLGETLVGKAAIDSFRAGRTRPPQERRYTSIVIAPLGEDSAVLTAIFDPVGKEGQEGRWTLAWLRIGQDWRIAAAHASLCPKPASVAG